MCYLKRCHCSFVTYNYKSFLLFSSLLFLSLSLSLFTHTHILLRMYSVFFFVIFCLCVETLTPAQGDICINVCHRLPPLCQHIYSRVVENNWFIFLPFFICVCIYMCVCVIYTEKESKKIELHHFQRKFNRNQCASDFF